MHIAGACRFLSFALMYRPAGTVTGVLLHHAGLRPLIWSYPLQGFMPAVARQRQASAERGT